MRRWKPRSQHRRRTVGFIDAWKRWADAEQLRWAAGWRAAELQADRVFLIATQSRKREPSKRASIGTAKAVPFRLRRPNLICLVLRGSHVSKSRHGAHDSMAIYWPRRAGPERLLPGRELPRPGTPLPRPLALRPEEKPPPELWRLRKPLRPLPLEGLAEWVLTWF